jgi:hypothetical protein
MFLIVELDGRVKGGGHEAGRDASALMEMRTGLGELVMCRSDKWVEGEQCKVSTVGNCAKRLSHVCHSWGKDGRPASLLDMESLSLSQSLICFYFFFLDHHIGLNAVVKVRLTLAYPVAISSEKSNVA